MLRRVLRRLQVTGSGGEVNHGVGCPARIAEMLAFAGRHGIAPVTESFPMSKVNEAMERLKSGRARYRLVLENDFAT